jgi:endonuclease/exonuclease/phosphatase family metal-dependent hydrolase
LPRVASWVRLRDKPNGIEWTIFNAHFDHKGERAREASAALLLKKMPEIARDSLIVLLGDTRRGERFLSDHFPVIAEVAAAK